MKNRNHLELYWKDKKTEVEKISLPFQVVETVNAPAERGLFGKELPPWWPEEWKNKLIWGDNKYIMSSLLDEFAGKINLIYIDPPFATGADFSINMKIGDLEWTKEASVIEERAYRDTWGKGLDSYLQMMYERLVLMRELLADNGSIYVHLDWRVGHYVKIMLDEIFGKDNFINEIVWHYKRWSNVASTFQKMHDMLLFYSKTTNKTFNLLYQEYAHPEWIEDTVRGIVNGRLVRLKDEMGNYIKREKENVGVPMHDVWEGINFIGPTASERIGYATQKPEALLERIIKVSSSEGDLVADFFCGTGTTGAVAEKLGRRWIMADLSKFAIHTTRKRLLDIQDCRPFEILNLGRYQRHKLKENGNALGVRYYKFILDLYRAEALPGFSYIHGKKAGRMVHIGDVDSIITEREIREATKECSEIGSRAIDILGWDFEMGLHDLVDMIGDEYGVKIRLVPIPKEALEVKSPASEEIKFFNLNYLDVGYEKEAKSIKVFLKDFIIANPEYLPEDVKEKVKRFTDLIDYWAVDFDFKDDTFHNMWQSFRTRRHPRLVSEAYQTYEKEGNYKILVKVVDIFGNDTNKLINVSIA